MRKVAILSAFALSCCGPSREELARGQLLDAKGSEKVHLSGIGVVKIDSCEYVFYNPGYRSGVSIIHKANCKNH